MPQEITCPGLPAHWLIAWLAAVGATLLNPGIRLRWTINGEAVLVAKDNPVALLVQSWPSKEQLNDLPIAENWGNADPMRRRVSVEVFKQRAQMARKHPHSWTLSSTVTDLCVNKNGEVEHAQFDPAGPGTIKWLHHRLIKLQKYLDELDTKVQDSLMGCSVRVKDNGLGFDQTRLGSLADNTDTLVDPVIETLAFFGLSMFPVRGNGIDQRLDRGKNIKKKQRGWRTIPLNRKFRQFHWPAWSAPLDYAGIDALMDAWDPYPKEMGQWARLGIHAGWRSIRYEKRGSADNTRAFGSVRL